MYCIISSANLHNELEKLIKSFNTISELVYYIVLCHILLYSLYLLGMNVVRRHNWLYSLTDRKRSIHGVVIVIALDLQT